MHELTKLIREDMKPALGVTEPGAIAFAAAKARSCVPGEVESVIKSAVMPIMPKSDGVSRLASTMFATATIP